ncbi:hypothetical protein [Roseivirga seohaensis]|uniref:hypothetical protein n=1 Tax=Roseivirga seohaensis TaxID=1914963 RepID=UPI003BA8558F
MKYRHISGLIDRIELMTNELTKLAENTKKQQQDLANQSINELREEVDVYNKESEKIKFLYQRINSEERTEIELELLREHFETQSKFTSYISTKIEKKAAIDAKLNQLVYDLNMIKMRSIMHKKDILEVGLRKYYLESGDEKNRVLDVLYNMIEDIEDNSFYNHAMDL